MNNTVFLVFFTLSNNILYVCWRSPESKFCPLINLFINTKVESNIKKLNIKNGTIEAIIIFSVLIKPIKGITDKTKPIKRLPESPINILAGLKLKIKKAKQLPIKAKQSMTATTEPIIE